MRDEAVGRNRLRNTGEAKSPDLDGWGRLIKLSQISTIDAMLRRRLGTTAGMTAHPHVESVSLIECPSLHHVARAG